MSSQSQQTAKLSTKEKGKLVSFNDILWTGCSLVIGLLLTAIGGGYVISLMDNIGFDNSINSEDDLETIHNEIKEYRIGLLISVALMWISVPFLFTHIYCFKLLCESLFTLLIPSKNSKPNSIVHYLKWMYILHFLIFTLMVCLFGIFTFLASYYYWAFVDISNDTSYIGYYIQFMLLRVVIVSSQCFCFCLIFVGCIPWILLLLSNLDIISKNDLCCIASCCFSIFDKMLIKGILIIMIIIIISGTVIDTFDWASSGFFDPANGASHGGYIVVISQFFAALWYVYLAFKVNTINRIINRENILQDYGSSNNY